MQFPVLHSRPWFIHSKCNSLHLPAPKSQSIPLHPLLPVGHHRSYFHVQESVSVLRVSSFVPYFTFDMEVMPYGISGPIRIAANGIILILFMAEQYSTVYMYHIFFIYCSVDGHLSFHVLALVNSAAMNSGVQVSFQILVLSGYMPRSEVAGSYVLCCAQSFSRV